MFHRKAQVRWSRRRVLGGLAVMVVSAAALLVANVETARASEIGQYGPATVSCDAATNTIWASPLVGAGTNFSGQTVRYRFWAVNRENGKSFWLGSSAWIQMYAHRQQGEGYYDFLGYYYPPQEVPYEPNPPLWNWNVYENTLTLHNGWNRLHVYVQYEWYSPTYRTFIGTVSAETKTYSNATYGITGFTGWASYPDCYL